MNLSSNKFGFTLIELLVGVAIVGILAAIAIPSYMASIRKSNRSDAKVEIMDRVQALQRCYTANGKFNPAVGVCPLVDQIKAKFVSRGGYYELLLSDLTATTYTITATPVTGKSQENDTDCPSFAIDQTGKKTANTGCW